MPRKNIYVCNLSFSATEDELRNLFSQHGAVHSVKIITDRETGRSRGFGFVEMDQNGADNAIAALNEFNLGGRSLRVNIARERGRQGGGGQAVQARTPADQHGGISVQNPGGGGGNQNNRFHNPYHFIPVGKPDDDKCVSKVSFLVGEGLRHSHAFYNGHSGRLVCKLTTVEPVFIGAHELEAAKNQTPKKLANFELGGKPAIPASSLRGVLSSIAEAASGSALRVLEDRALSFRKERGESLSALGMIVKNEGKFKLRPLSMPTLVRDGNCWKFPDDGDYSKMFPPLTQKQNATGVLPMKIYVGDYTQADSKETTIIKSNNSFSSDNEKYFYLELNKTWNFNNGFLATGNNNNLHIKSIRYVTAQEKVDRNQLPLPEDEYSVLDSDKQKLYTRGILRILGKDQSDRKDIPRNSKHELFIPYPEDIDKIKCFPIDDVAIDRYHKLAEERADTTKADERTYIRHPYLPKGTRQEVDKNFWKLKEGDIVYFRPDTEDHNGGHRVAEISFSSIWRNRVESERKADTVHEFFKKIDNELLPFNKERKKITPAELLFGFVQGGEKKEEGEDDRMAYAGKVRVSFGITNGECNNWYYSNDEDGFDRNGYVPLKILDSPKPPCPAMYFKRKANNGYGYISKSSLNLKADVPQGRKTYLHRKNDDKGERKTGPWKTNNPKENWKQKASIRPIKTDVTFYFHIDFNNLDDWELGLLCYALQPCESFHHKIGMGKSLGLGTVKIEPVGLFMMDRKNRYKETDLFDNGKKRYHSAYIASENDLKNLPKEIYGYEKNNGAVTKENLFATYQNEYSRYIKRKYPAAANALKLLGDPGKVKHPVRTPQVINAADDEEKTYRWFVANDIGTGSQRDRLDPCEKHLEPLDESSSELPWLPKHEWRD